MSEKGGYGIRKINLHITIVKVVRKSERYNLTLIRYTNWQAQFLSWRQFECPHCQFIMDRPNPIVRDKRLAIRNETAINKVQN